MSNTINVTSLLELNEALSTATGGETILLAPGDYGNLALTGKSGFDITFPSNVTITSANPQDPAVFSGLNVRDAANLTFDGVTFDYTFQTGDPLWITPFSVTGSENITIRNSTFDGDLPSGVSTIVDGYGYGTGLSTSNNTGLTIDQNEFFDFYRGLTVSASEDIVVSSNDISALRSDGMNFSEVTGVLVENNYLHDFRASPNSGDHADMIQFWTYGTQTPSSDIVIRGNQLDIGDGSETQSIFMRNEAVDSGGAGQEMYYSNVTIEDNVIVNGHQWGIFVGETNGLTIQSNSVLHDDGGAVDGADTKVEIPLISVASGSANVTISQNATADIYGYSNQSDWTVRNNAFVQDQNPSDSGYYGDIFLASSLQAEDGVHNFIALPDSILAVLSAGAPQTLSPTDDSGSGPIDPVLPEEPPVVDEVEEPPVVDEVVVPPVIDEVEEPPVVDEVVVPPVVHGVEEPPVVDEVVVPPVVHGVEEPPVVDEVVVPPVIDEVEEPPVVDEVVVPPVVDEVEEPPVVDEVVVPPVVDEVEEPPVVDEVVEIDLITSAVVIGGTDTAESIDRERVVDLLGTSDFDISMTLTADSGASRGVVTYLDQSLITSVNGKGELTVQAFTEDGEKIRLTTDGANLDDKKPHDISIALNEGMLEITVDGDMLAGTAMTSPLANKGDLDLVFGNPSGRHSFEGVVSKLSITLNESDLSGASNPTDTFVESVPSQEVYMLQEPLDQMDHFESFMLASVDM